MNAWEEKATKLVHKSLNPIPQELNEIDWKCALSTKTERLAQHISAFANYPGGGFLAIGINNDGKSSPLSKTEMDEIILKLGNIARNSLAQPIGIEHAVITYNDNPVLFIHIPEQQNKPVNLRGPNIFDSYTRSAGQTVKLSRHEVTQLIAFSTGYDFESQAAMSNVDKDEVIGQLDY
ncbi:MAG: ATP-binding protein, partial [Bacteroidia bacterium]|nr:ATP-binding protein [Bacteroidia bacterium]